MTDVVAHASPDGAGRVFVVWTGAYGSTDTDAAVAHLAGERGLQPADTVVIVRWLSEGEAPPPQEQSRWLGEGEGTMNTGAGHAEG